jgi:peptide/nickel transport system permease protein
LPSPSYVLTRLLQIIPTFLFIMVVVFVLVRLLPGDPASAILGERATDESVERINRQLGLDQPIPVQFAIFVERFLGGDLGISIHLKIPVMQLIQERLPVTLMLTIYAAILALLMALPLAFVAAVKRDRGADAAIRGAFQVGLSMPVFYIGLILLTVFAANLRWFPVGGFGET